MRTCRRGLQGGYYWPILIIGIRIAERSLPFVQQDKEVINQWSESAPYWEKHRTMIREMFQPVTQPLIADAGIRSGHSVLDVAMGPGEPALSIADAVGPQGKVVGTDAV